MNQQCKVCGEPAAGFHFGAFTCEGCKSFFGRTYNNLGSITECKNNGDCVINKKNRTACKACRLRKCLLVGMSKSGSRYGRRSNWFKIHCLLEEQNQNGNKMPSNYFAAAPGFYPRSLYSHPLLSPDKILALNGYPRKEEVRSESGESSPGDADDDTRTALSFLRPPSSHTTPSPKHISPFSSSLLHPSSPVGTNPPYSPPVTTGGIFFPPQTSPLMYAPKGCTFPTTPVFTSWPPPRVPFSEDILCGPTPRTPMGGDLLLRSPTIGGVAVEQDAPIDLSVKTSFAYQPPTPRSERSRATDSDDDDDDDNLSIDVGVCNEAISLKNNPIDLTAKRVEVPQSG